MKRIHFITLLLIVSNSFIFAQKKDITTYPRVKKAYQEKEATLKRELKQKGIELRKVELLLVGLKEDKELEAWVRNKGDKKFKLFKTYSICANSGTLGPKRRRGDGQVPEGVYRINYFNPWSNFHLSMKVNYPNRSDKVRGKKNDLGNDIFIHGSCVTIGCIPLTDEVVKEFFVLAVEANRNKKIDVLLLPTRLNDKSVIRLNKKYAGNEDAKRLWTELLPIYRFFEKNAYLPKVRVSSQGKYYIQK